ncbi:MAG: LytR C-terminal domain-containing protein [Candidatus Marinimicrobia bacterium]|nr:LytR C-terminal domain-containing protein [Candidatus Neomarinimicrobiota bacterium]
MNVVIILFIVIIGFFGYSAWVDRPARIREFTEVKIPKDMPNLRMSAENTRDKVDIVVRVLNGCGVSGVGYKLREYLLTEGFDVYETANADHFNYEKTIVYLHANNYEMSTIVSQKLNIANNPVLDDRAPDYPCNVTIVIGKNYKQLTPFIDK